MTETKSALLHVVIMFVLVLTASFSTGVFAGSRYCVLLQIEPTQQYQRTMLGAGLLPMMLILLICLAGPKVVGTRAFVSIAYVASRVACLVLLALSLKHLGLPESNEYAVGYVTIAICRGGSWDTCSTITYKNITLAECQSTEHILPMVNVTAWLTAAIEILCCFVLCIVAFQKVLNRSRSPPVATAI